MPSEREPSPARRKSSTVIYIRNLVRPFTVNQLKELLARTGKITDFWIDNIKSKCYCMYETEAQSVETRTALHGVRWPPSNPKKLLVDYAPADELDHHKALTEPIPRKTEPLKVDPFFATRQQEEQRAEGAREKRREVVREWDRVKIGETSPGEKERERELRRREREEQEAGEKRKRRSRSKEKEEKKEKRPAEKRQKEEAPAKLLDDLFRKTKTTPCIYWLPLTAEQIAEKEQQRRLRMAERQKRLEAHQAAAAAATKTADKRGRSRSRSRSRSNSRRRR